MGPQASSLLGLYHLDHRSASLVIFQLGLKIFNISLLPTKQNSNLLFLILLNYQSLVTSSDSLLNPPLKPCFPIFYHTGSFHAFTLWSCDSFLCWNVPFLYCLAYSNPDYPLAPNPDTSQASNWNYFDTPQSFHNLFYFCFCATSQHRLSCIFIVCYVPPLSQVLKDPIPSPQLVGSKCSKCSFIRQEQ